MWGVRAAHSHLSTRLGDRSQGTMLCFPYFRKGWAVRYGLAMLPKEHKLHERIILRETLSICCGDLRKVNLRS